MQINEYFAGHPEHILGDLRAVHGQYSAVDVTVRPGRVPLGSALPAALASITQAALKRGLGWKPRRPEGHGALPAPVSLGMPRRLKEGSIVATGGGFARIVAGTPETFVPRPARDVAELAELVQLRDLLTELLDRQSSVAGEDPHLGVLQGRLGERYDAYVRRHGPLNRFRLIPTGRTADPDDDEPVRRMEPPMGGMRADPDFPALRALEMFDPETQTARKAAIFTRRVVAPRHRPLGAESAQDALALCLDERGRVDLDAIAGLLGVDPPAARTDLGDLVWDDPASGTIVTAEEYLSGDVRAKLAAAQAAAATDARWSANVAALAAVVPSDLEPGDIDARLGAPWIDAAEVAAFGREVLGARWLDVEYVAASGTWSVQAPAAERRTVAMTSEWGTSRADGVVLLGWSLRQQTAAVYDHHDDGSRTLNPEETLAAREKQEALEERFRIWVWEEPERAARLAARYNTLFNSRVLPVYDGSHLSLPGVAETFTPHPHQRAAVWRIVQEPTVLLAHAVGAGKTATMVMAGMELRRLGLVRKPAYVVPNHMLEQFSREFLQLYPQASILVATRDRVTPQGRREFVARCATGDWDAIVITQSAFERIPVSAATEARFVAEQIEGYRAAIAGAEHPMTVKRLQGAMLREEQRHRRLLNTERRDVGVTFEMTGIDYLFADEAHAYKNLHFTTHVQGVGGEGSHRAEDLDLKLSYLRSRHGGRVATLATATPIANSIAEMFVMQSYLQPGTLDAARIRSFDAWAATFGRSVTALELAPDGGSYRLKTRFARFANVPELLTMFRAVADVRTPEDLRLSIPVMAGGRAETVVVPASEGLTEYVATLVERAERVRNRAVASHEDNMLKISGDGRRAALDLRLVGSEPDPSGGKIAAAAARIAQIEVATRALRYVDADRAADVRPGALQLVFCDLSTPQEGWNAYDELRSRLVALGIPRERIRFIHEANDDRAKAELFAAARDGRVAVLLGSTERMGVGTNVQQRAVALHHLDCPWRPADIEQREGRILRQGNQNSDVEIVRYATEGSFDIFMWQTVERKAGFIHQVMRGGVDAREIDDVGEQALSFAEVKALATGNPLIMELAGVDGEIAKLERLAASHQRDRRTLEWRADEATHRAERMAGVVTSCDAATALRRDTRGDRFSMSVGGQVHSKRVDAGQRLRQVVAQELERGGPAVSAPIGEVGGLPIVLRVRRDLDEPRVELSLSGVPGRATSLTRADVLTAEPVGLVQRLEHCLEALETIRRDAESGAAAARLEAEQARARTVKPFEHGARLAGLRSRQTAIKEQLMPPAPADRCTPDAPSPLAPVALAARRLPPPDTDQSVPIGALSPSARPPGPSA